MANGTGDRIDALVVGAGPTGLTVAGQLLRHGATCRIVEKASEISEKSRAIGIQARTLELFANMRIVDEFTSRGLQAHGGRVYTHGHQLANFDLGWLESPYPYILLLHQAETERILETYLHGQGGHVERSTELTSFSQDAEGVTATVQRAGAEPETIRSRWILGCDGAHSDVRQILGLPFEGEQYPELFALADVAFEWEGAVDKLSVFLHEDGPVAVFPLGHGRYRIILFNPLGSRTDYEGEPPLSLFQEILDSRGCVPARVSDPKWTAFFRVHRRLVSTLASGHAFLAGDSANIHSPVGAQGMNTGIQDACNLAWKVGLVARRLADETLLESYNRERYPVQVAVIRGTSTFTKVVNVHSKLAQAVRAAVMPLVTGIGAIQHQIFRAISEISVEYEPSDIIEDHGAHHGGPRAGQRAPYAPITAPDGAGSVFDLLRGANHKLIVFYAQHVERQRQLAADVAADLRPHVKLIDLIQMPIPPDGTNHAVVDAYGAKDGALFLIRPDGYIAYRGPLDQAERLDSYLKRLFRAPVAA